MRKPNSTNSGYELRHRAESRLRSQKKKSPPNAGNLEQDANTLRMRHELDVLELELEMQNIELQSAKGERDVALDKFNYFYDFSLDGYLSIDKRGLIKEINLEGAALLGVHRSRLINRHLLLFISTTSRPVFLDFIKRAFTIPQNQACEALILKEGGDTFWAGFRTASAERFKGARKSCQFKFGDITSQKLAAQLSSRELQVLRLVAQGKPSKTIAVELGIAQRTVEKHRTHLMVKLNIHDIAGLTHFAILSGVFEKNARRSTS